MQALLKDGINPSKLFGRIDRENVFGGNAGHQFDPFSLGTHHGGHFGEVVLAAHGIARKFLAQSTGPPLKPN